MHSKLNFASDVAVPCCNIGNGQRGNLPDAQTTANGQHEAKTIALSVTSGFDDAKHVADFGFLRQRQAIRLRRSVWDDGQRTPIRVRTNGAAL